MHTLFHVQLKQKNLERTLAHVVLLKQDIKINDVVLSGNSFVARANFSSPLTFTAKVRQGPTQIIRKILTVIQLVI